MFEFDNLKFQLRIGRSFNPLTTQVEIRLYTEQQKDLIFHLSFWASLCSWHLDEILQFKNAGISRFKFTLILNLTDFPNLNYPAYQKKRAQSVKPKQMQIWILDSIMFGKSDFSLFSFKFVLIWNRRHLEAER